MAGFQALLSQDSLETILARLPCGLLMLDLQGNVLSCNPAAQGILERHFGWPVSGASDSQRLPREIQTGVEYLCEVFRLRCHQSPPPSLSLTTLDLSLHLFLLLPKAKMRGQGAKNVIVVVVFHSQAPSLSEPWEKPASLSPREQEVLHWLVRGKTRKEISIILGLSEATVRTYLERLYAKLGVNNKIEAANAVSQQHLIECLGGTLQPS